MSYFPTRKIRIPIYTRDKIKIRVFFTAVSLETWGCNVSIKEVNEQNCNECNASGNLYKNNLCGLSLYSAMEFQEGVYTDAPAVTLCYSQETPQHLM